MNRLSPTVRAVAIVTAVAIAACVIGIGNDFANDDLHLIADNVRIQDLNNWTVWFTHSFWPPPYSPDLYRPLTSALLAFEYVLGAGSPAVYRVVSYLLYVAASVGVFAFARRIMANEFALAAALLFAAHPVHTEAVALGVAQNELVVGIISLAMCARYLDARRGQGLVRRDWLILGALYLVACLMKEQGFVLPLFLVAIEIFLLTNRPRTRGLVGGYAVLACIGGVVLLVRRAVLGDLAGTFVAEALDGLGPSGRALTMLSVVPHWARLFLWPAHLRGDYSAREIVASTGFGPREMTGIAILIGVGILGFVLRKRAPAASFGIEWCAIGLLPVSNVLIPTGIVLAERTLFLPSIGVAIALAALAQLVLAHAPRALKLAQVALVGLVALGVGRSIERQRVWRNEAFFIARSVQDDPLSFRMQQAYGDLLFAAAQPELARQAYDRATQLAPDALRWRVRNDYAKTLAILGDEAGEAEQLSRSLEQAPRQEDARAKLIVAELDLGRYTDARREADTAIALGGKRDVFVGLRDKASDAARTNAPAGTVKIVLNMGAVVPNRGP